jgi:hypothetical protein
VIGQAEERVLSSEDLSRGLGGEVMDKVVVKMRVFWDIALFRLIGVNRRFRGAY